MMPKAAKMANLGEVSRVEFNSRLQYFGKTGGETSLLFKEHQVVWFSLPFQRQIEMMMNLSTMSRRVVLLASRVSSKEERKNERDEISTKEHKYGSLVYGCLVLILDSRFDKIFDIVGTDSLGLVSFLP